MKKQYVTPFYKGLIMLVILVLLGGCKSNDNNDAPTPVTTDFVWAKSGGGAGSDAAIAMTIDAANNLYVIGRYQDNANFSGFNLQGSGYNIFLVKYDTTGKTLWAKSLGACNSLNYKIAVDASGNLYIAGNFKKSITLGSITLTTALSVEPDDYATNLFLAKCNAQGNVLWAKNIEQNTTYVSSISADQTGNIYVTGSYSLFYAKYDASGNELWAERHSDSDSKTAGGMVDVEGNFWVAGDYFGGIFRRIFLFKYNPQGTVIVGGQYDYFGNHYLLTGANKMCRDALGNTYLLIEARDDSSSLPNYPPIESYAWAKFNSSCVFVKKKEYSKRGVFPMSIVANNLGKVYMTGYFFNNSNFENTILTSGGRSDIFVYKTDDALGSNYDVVTAGKNYDDLYRSDGDRAYDMVFDTRGNLYIAGFYYNTIQIGNTKLSSGNNNPEMFIAKMKP